MKYNRIKPIKKTSLTSPNPIPFPDVAINKIKKSKNYVKGSGMIPSSFKSFSEEGDIHFSNELKVE